MAATSEKLDVLKSAEAQVQKQFENGEVSEEQYRALQREIVKTEADLKNLKTAAEDSNSTLEKVGEIAGKIGKKLSLIHISKPVFTRQPIPLLQRERKHFNVKVHRSGVERLL